MQARFPLVQATRRAQRLPYPGGGRPKRTRRPPLGRPFQGSWNGFEREQVVSQVIPGLKERRMPAQNLAAAAAKAAKARDLGQAGVKKPANPTHVSFKDRIKKLKDAPTGAKVGAAVGIGA